MVLQSVVAIRQCGAAGRRATCSRASLATTENDPYESLRAQMVAEIAAEAALTVQYTGRAAFSGPVMRAMATVPRHEFVPPEYLGQAYGDHPLPIGHGQTLSQPYIVGFMTETIRPRPGMKVLEVGTGSGYQAAILAAIGCEVYSIEMFEPLATRARSRLARL